MTPRVGPVALLTLLAACPPPQVAACEVEGVCDTTGSVTTGGAATPTTSDGTDAITDADSGASSTAPDSESGVDTTGTTEQPALPPEIVDGVVMPDHVDANGLLAVTVTTQEADGVRMAIDGRAAIELTPALPDEFVGQIAAFTGLDNGKHTALFTPWRGALVGESVAVDYEIALPPPGSEVLWDSEEEEIEGYVAAIGVRPDGNPVELRTYQAMDGPRCFLILRTRDGKWMASDPLLPNSHCEAIDMTVDPESGVMHLLVERLSGDGPRWWAGELGGWGAAAKNIGIGEVGDEALAIAARPGLVAVCGAKPVATADKRDAMAVLLRKGQPAEQRLFDYQPPGDQMPHEFKDAIRDCTFAGAKLVMVGETFGKHDVEPIKRDRLALVEYDPASDQLKWSVAGPGPGVQSRALALTVDDQGRYHLAGYTCLDDCVPQGEVRVHAPGGGLVSQVAFPLGSAWFGPHDIAWSPAGYAVVALGEMQGPSFKFKVQAFAPGVPAPLWTFVSNHETHPEFALAVAVGPFGDVYAGGIAGMSTLFAVIGG